MGGPVFFWGTFEDAKGQGGKEARSFIHGRGFVTGFPVRGLLCISVLLSGAVPAVPAQGPGESGKYVPPLSDLLGRRTSELRDLVERVDVDLRNLNRRWPVGYSPARSAALRGFHSAWKARVEEMDFGKLSQDGKVDYLLLRNGLASELSLLAREDTRYTEMSALLRELGYSVRPALQSGGLHDVDLLLGMTGHKVAVQLKRWNSPVGDCSVYALFTGGYITPRTKRG